MIIEKLESVRSRQRVYNSSDGMWLGANQCNLQYVPRIITGNVHKLKKKAKWVVSGRIPYVFPCRSITKRQSISLISEKGKLDTEAWHADYWHDFAHLRLHLLDQMR